MKKTITERLNEKFDINPETGCWEWKAYKCKSGYGEFRISGKKMRAHRVIFEIKFGSIPEGMFICHHCDNPPCVNPSHLFLGTPMDNTRDMMNKGRLGPRNKVQPWNAGSKNGNCFMSEELVEALRGDRKTGVSLTKLAAKYGCSLSSASRLCNFKTHKESVLR